MTSNLANRLRHSREAQIVVVLIAFASAALVLAYQLGRPHIDLEVYRFAVWEWWRGGDVYGPLPQTDGGRGLSLPFIYPPFAVVMASPFAAVPWWLSYTLLFSLSIACVFGTLFLIARHLLPASGRGGAVLIGAAGVPLALAVEPVRDTFEFGQINLLLMGLVAADCLATRTRWPRGIGVGIAAAIKLTPAAFVLFFLVRRDYKAAAVAAVTGIAATGIGFLTDLSGSMQYWFGGFAGAAGISGSTFRTNQTLQAAFARFDIPQPALAVVVAVAVVAVFAVLVYAMYRSTPVVALLLCAAFSLLASPTSWSHHWVWIIPALVVMTAYTARALRAGQVSGWLLLGGTVVTAIAFLVGPFHHLPGNDDWTPALVDLETTWLPLQHLIGNAYVVIGIAWIVACAVTAARTSRSAGRPTDAAGQAEQLP